MSKLEDVLRRSVERRVRAKETAPDAVAASLSEKISKTSGARVTTGEGTKKSSLDDIIRRGIENRQPDAFKEVDRIVNLPVVWGASPEDREAVQRHLVQAQAYDEGFRLHDIQCDAYLAYRDHGHVAAFVGVGWGKTIMDLLIAKAHSEMNVPGNSMLLVPPQVYSQLTEKDLPQARRLLNLAGVRFFGVQGTAKKRMQTASSGLKGCYIVPYSILSTRDAVKIIEAISPSLIIADEAHCLKNSKSARTKRIMKYVRDAGPSMAILSGTLTSKSVMDYYHLVHPMGEYNPLPMQRNIAVDWGSVLDSGADSGALKEKRTGPLTPLLDWAGRHTDLSVHYSIASFRAAYRARLQANPVVISSGDKELGTSLTLCPQDPTEVYGAGPDDELKEMISTVEDEWVAPNGDEIDFGMHLYKWLFELTAGFYNDLYWPTPETVAKRLRCDEKEAQRLLDLAEGHHTIVQAYNKSLREFLSRGTRRGLDTPMLVAAHMKRNGAEGVPDEMYRLWKEAHDLKAQNPDMPDRDSRVVRVDPYKVEAAKQWALKHGEGIIWYHHQGIGEWLHELMPDAIWCPAGDKHNRTIADSKGKLVIASITAHGTGKNLQFHRHQLFVQFPRPARDAEQTLGRLHRVGQEADELLVHILLNRGVTTPTFDDLNYAATLTDALYIQQTTGSRQKVVYAGYDPIPRVFSRAVLEERGLDQGLATLNARQQRMLDEKFDTSLDARKGKNS